MYNCAWARQYGTRGDRPKQLVSKLQNGCTGARAFVGGFDSHTPLPLISPGSHVSSTPMRDAARLRREKLALRDDLLRLPVTLPEQLDNSGPTALIVRDRNGIALARRQRNGTRV